MASSGTIGLTLEFQSKMAKHDTVFVAGKTKVKSTAVIEAGDLELRTIKAFVLTPYATPINATYVGTYGYEPTVVYGSVTLSGSLMNSVTITVLKGSHNPLTGGVGTAHLGTIKHGSVQVSFAAVGA